ncbi:MAG: LysM peptidoglycan-binding domain-containing protein [Dysgonamonadaceae bacterium]|jgi:LysM repeat protein|nr:LysM peptidoglycan-binding domain-containing protein [Dysgonamonadaceae bacterium]
MRYRVFWFLILLFFYHNACPQDTTYVVQKGEGLYAIARKLDVSVPDLCKWNVLTPKSVIYPGQQLRVYRRQGLRHVVKKGETLYSIARRWNVTVGDLQEWNGLSDHSIRPGQELTVGVAHRDTVMQQATDSGYEPAVKPLIRFRTRQRILVFGDSMIEGLNRRMRQYAAENEHDVLNVIWYSSSTKWWAQHIDTLEHFMKTFHPTYIIVCLGANELFIKNIESRDRYIKQILGRIGSLPYAWVGPPNWRNDTGINNLIKGNTGEERFFPSKNYRFVRTKDGAHLTRAAADEWMDMIARWLNNDAPEPLLMNTPSNEAGMQGKNVLLMPLKEGV